MVMGNTSCTRSVEVLPTVTFTSKSGIGVKNVRFDDLRNQFLIPHAIAMGAHFKLRVSSAVVLSSARLTRDGTDIAPTIANLEKRAGNNIMSEGVQNVQNLIRACEMRVGELVCVELDRQRLSLPRDLLSYCDRQSCACGTNTRL